MKKRFLIFMLLSIFFIVECDQTNVDKHSECLCDSIAVEKDNRLIRCFYQNKLLKIERSRLDDTILIKKYILSNDNVFRKFEYITIVNGNIIQENSAYVDISISGNIVDISVVSPYISQYIELVCGLDTVKSDDNKLKSELSKLKQIREINSFRDIKMQDSSVDRVTYISSYYYNYDEISNEKTLLRLYKSIMDCKSISK